MNRYNRVYGNVRNELVVVLRTAFNQAGIYASGLATLLTEGYPCRG
jgi:hypothetical protein